MSSGSVEHDMIRQSVRARYGEIAVAEDSGGCSTSCCSPVTEGGSSISRQLGYSEEELASLPDGADMGLGCGNPQVIAALRAGETVLDLGSGGGLDCFLAARAVGPTGYVIGVDMTPAMISKARLSAERAGTSNVDFRLGEIENLPVADHTVDVVISNCVVNLSPNKPQVFRETYRVLRPGGRVAISDVVAFASVPYDIRHDATLYSGCVAGASSLDDVAAMLHDVGFVDVHIEPRFESASFMKQWTPGTDITDYAVAATIEAVKPRERS